MKRIIEKIKSSFTVVSMERIEQAFDIVRQELGEVGLLEDGRYLDRIDCRRMLIPSPTECGCNYDEGVPWYDELVTFKPGEIYIRPNIEAVLADSGETIEDVIRHEFAHAW